MAKRFSVHQFDNGLTVVLEPMPQASSAAIGFFVNTGARHEDPALDGVSHFLEHMMFKGTETRTWQDINREFDEMGARYNAFTAWEETCYYAWVLKEDLTRALGLLSDMLQPKLPEAEFEAEKKVVLEEIARYQDQPDHQVFDSALKMAFAGHRLSSNILGTPQTIGRLACAQMRNYFQQRYVPNNIVLIACGNIDEQHLLAETEKLWGRRVGPRAGQKLVQPVFRAGTRFIRKKDAARQHLVMLWPEVPLESRETVAASLLGAVLGDDHNSRLYWALRHSGLAEDAGASYWGFSDAGLMAAQVACDAAKTPRVVDLLRKEAAKLKRGIREEELRRAKNRARTSLVFGAETPFDRFRQVMQQWTSRRELLTPEELLARVEDVQIADLDALVSRFPLEAECALVGLGPYEAGGRASSKARPAPAPAAPRKKTPPAKKPAANKAAAKRAASAQPKAGKKKRAAARGKR